MPRYFFDIFANGERTQDDDGLEFDSLDEVRFEAMDVLPAIARDAVTKDANNQIYTVLVSDGDHQPVYSATMTFAGLWLRRG